MKVEIFDLLLFLLSHVPVGVGEILVAQVEVEAAILGYCCQVHLELVDDILPAQGQNIHLMDGAGSDRHLSVDTLVFLFDRGNPERCAVTDANELRAGRNPRAVGTSSISLRLIVPLLLCRYNRRCDRREKNIPHPAIYFVLYNTN